MPAIADMFQCTAPHSPAPQPALPSAQHRHVCCISS